MKTLPSGRRHGTRRGSSRDHAAPAHQATTKLKPPERPTPGPPRRGARPHLPTKRRPGSDRPRTTAPTPPQRSARRHPPTKRPPSSDRPRTTVRWIAMRDPSRRSGKRPAPRAAGSGGRGGASWGGGRFGGAGVASLPARSDPFYSCLSTRMGSTRLARLAGR